MPGHRKFPVAGASGFSLLSSRSVPHDRTGLVFAAVTAFPPTAWD